MMFVYVVYLGEILLFSLNPQGKVTDLKGHIMCFLLKVSMLHLHVSANSMLNMFYFDKLVK